MLVGCGLILMLLLPAVAAGQPTAEPQTVVQLRLLEGRELSAAASGLAFLRRLADIDTRRVAVVAHSFGSSLTLLQAEKEPELRALVIFSAAGYSWDRSPELRMRLLDATAKIRTPVFFIRAARLPWLTVL